MNQSHTNNLFNASKKWNAAAMPACWCDGVLRHVSIRPLQASSGRLVF
ncbi:MAG: hypothetical protein AAGH72_06200 [Verrucomicrobiota bacterium]